MIKSRLTFGRFNLRQNRHVTTEPDPDLWAAWLGQRGHGGDPEVLRRQQELLAPIRD